MWCHVSILERGKPPTRNSNWRLRTTLQCSSSLELLNIDALDPYNWCTPTSSNAQASPKGRPKGTPACSTRKPWHPCLGVHQSLASQKGRPKEHMLAPQGNRCTLALASVNRWLHLRGDLRNVLLLYKQIVAPCLGVYQSLHLRADLRNACMLCKEIVAPLIGRQSIAGFT